MRRADRLFQIVQILRRDRLTTAAALARELSVNVRTVYRDIADLGASGVPIESEAGVGYRLPRSFDLPPLMFNVDELEALLAGLRIVRAWGDPALGEGAQAALLKVEVAVSPEIRKRTANSEIHAPDFFVHSGGARFMGGLRMALRERLKVRMRYRRGDGLETERVVRPLGIFFWGHTWSLAAWCELRDTLRTFRVDRVLDLVMLEEHFEPTEGKALDDYLRSVDAEAAVWEKAPDTPLSGGSAKLS